MNIKDLSLDDLSLYLSLQVFLCNVDLLNYKDLYEQMDKLDDNKYRLQIRNRVFTTDTLELIRPKEDPIQFKVKEFLNTKNDEIVDVVHPNTFEHICSKYYMCRYAIYHC